MANASNAPSHLKYFQTRLLIRSVDRQDRTDPPDNFTVTLGQKIQNILEVELLSFHGNIVPIAFPFPVTMNVYRQVPGTPGATLYPYTLIEGQYELPVLLKLLNNWFSSIPLIPTNEQASAVDEAIQLNFDQQTNYIVISVQWNDFQLTGLQFAVDYQAEPNPVWAALGFPRGWRVSIPPGTPATVPTAIIAPYDTFDALYPNDIYINIDQFPSGTVTTNMIATKFYVPLNGRTFDAIQKKIHWEKETHQKQAITCNYASLWSFRVQIQSPVTGNGFPGMGEFEMYLGITYDKDTH